MKRSLLALGGESFETPFDMLGGCHRRIRFFTDVASRIAIPTAPSEEVAAAASRLVLYFGTAMPLHEEDEEKTLQRAMTDYAVSGSAALFNRLLEDHRAIEAILDRLLPRWRALAIEPAAIGEHRPALVEDAEALARAFEPHLDMEENELFPLARRSIPDDVQGRMLRAMRNRREPMTDALHSIHTPKEIRS